MGTAACSRRRDDTAKESANASSSSAKPGLRFECHTEVSFKTRQGTWANGVIESTGKDAYGNLGYLIYVDYVETPYCQFVKDDQDHCRIVGGKHWLEAVQKRDLSALKGADLDLRDNKNNRRPCLLACADEGWIEGVRWLTSRRAFFFAPRVDVNGCDRGKRTALHAATRLGHHAIMEALLVANADVDAEQKVEEELEREGVQDARDLWLQTPPSHIETPLYCAVERADLDACKLLCKYKADVNKQVDNSNTPFRIIAEKEHSQSRLDIARLLMTHGADINLGSKDKGEDQPVLLTAVSKSDVAFVRLLLEMRADVNVEGGKSLHGGMSALHLAARVKSVPMVYSLVEARGDLTKLTSTGKTPADIARSNRAPRIAEYLDGTSSASEREQFAADALLG